MRTILITLFVMVLLTTAAVAQRNVTPALDRDPILEADAKHNLDVAQQAFTPLKKAYKQVLSRFEETYAAYPTFSKMDEFLYIAGMSSWYLSENKGKQKVNLRQEKEKEKYDPKRLKEDAVAYLNILIEKYPDSKRVDDARAALKLIEASK